ncbi:hypothetical protein Ae201684P_013995 [Aphanomyces euteiches]|uniref:Uncharacterized protein n=1 Tax=Aphanomyces euteiches TaxID=100861 RepID=A0A6G0W707_9STRA|nr:hypothetical protein Ae201684_018315 [Aphanomyces euteiches]KAH9083095.1 hypothetical protein Ae201684P_013995 [Aphanomyces euteiches]KAH9137341.1 hypothetical protein AeRB84_017891 [Aphanomyces euteiches]
MSKTFLNEYAVAFSTIGLFTNITAFMPGNKASEWTDAYAILRAGHWPLLDPSKITPTTMDDAAADGRLDIVAWLQEHHSEVGCTTNAMDLAAAGGHLDIVKFLHQYRTEGCTKNAMTQAAAGGYLDVVEYLFHSTTYKFDMTDAMRHATEFNHKDVVEWLERQHLRCPPLMGSNSVLQKECLGSSQRRYYALQHSGQAFAKPAELHKVVRYLKLYTYSIRSMPPKPPPASNGGTKSQKSKATKQANTAKPPEKATSLPKLTSTKLIPAKSTSPIKAKADGSAKMPTLETKPSDPQIATATASNGETGENEVSTSANSAQVETPPEVVAVEAAEVDQALLQTGNVVLKYEMYSESFVIEKGSMTGTAIDEAYCLSFVMPNCRIHLSMHEPAMKLALESQGDTDNVFLHEEPPGTYHGLQVDQTYYVYIEQEADQLAWDQAHMREIALTMEGAAEDSKRKADKKDDGRGFESCSCIEGNPCVDEYGCKDWHNRFAIAAKHGWKWF